MIQVSALIVSFAYIDAATVFVNVTWTAPDAPAPWNDASHPAGFTIVQPFVSTLDQQIKIQAGLAAWLLVNAGFVASSVIVGLTQPAMDHRGRQYTKTSGVETRTYGRYGAPCDAFTAIGPLAPETSRTTKRTYVLPFDLDLIEGTVLLTGGQSGDAARFTVAPLTPLNVVAGMTMGVPPPGVPVLAAPIAVGDKQITLNRAALNAFVDLALIDSGLWEVVVTDGVHTDAYGPLPLPGEQRMPINVTAYDRETGVVELGCIRIATDDDVAPPWAGFEFAYAQNAMVLLTRAIVPRLELNGGNIPLVLGRAARGAAPVKAGVKIVLEYTRNSPGDVRNIVIFDVMTGQPE